MFVNILQMNVSHKQCLQIMPITDHIGHYFWEKIVYQGVYNILVQKLVQFNDH